MTPYRQPILQRLLDFAFPAPCAVCAEPPSVLCTKCRALMRAETKFEPVRIERAGLEGLRLTTYSPACAALMASVKEQGQTSVWGALEAEVRMLGEGLAARWPGARLICVPSSRSAMRRRGVNPAELLGRRVARAARMPVVGGLRLVRQPQDQATLSQEERAANLRDSMSFNPPRGQGGPLIIFDDVVTTGATILEARRAISAAPGAPLVAGFCVFAETLRKRSPSGPNESMFSAQAT